jgi:hypothetical protein
MKKQAGSIAFCYKQLMAAVVEQAIKDKALWFLKSDLCKHYCTVTGIKQNRFTLLKQQNHAGAV